MPDRETVRFSDYANFENREKTPVLPAKGAEIGESTEISSGAYTSTVEIPGNKVAKISRVLKVSIPENNSKDKVQSLIVEIQGTEGERYLAPKGTEEKNNRQSAFEKMWDLAAEKKRGYALTTRYVGRFVPQMHFISIVESPRRELEKRQNKELTPEQAEQIPNAEVALMEIWEKVDVSKSFQNLGYEQLRELFENPEYKEQAREFAEGALRLLEEQSVYLDICDRGGGIRAFRPTCTRTNVRSLDELASIKSEKTIIYPRNMTFSEGKLSYYDTFPIHKVAETVPTDTILKVKKYLSNNDYYGLALLEQRSKDPREIQLLARYLYLLRDMGANLEMSQKFAESYPFSVRPGETLGKGYESIVKDMGPDWVVKEFNPDRPDGTPKSLRAFQRSQSKEHIREMQKVQDILSSDEYYGDKLVQTHWVVGSDENGTEKVFSLQKRLKGPVLQDEIAKATGGKLDEQAFTKYFEENPAIRQQLLELMWTSKKVFVNYGVFEDFHLQNLAIETNPDGKPELKLFDLQNILWAYRILYEDKKASPEGKRNILQNTHRHIERYNKFEEILNISPEERQELDAKYGIGEGKYDNRIESLLKMSESME